MDTDPKDSSEMKCRSMPVSTVLQWPAMRVILPPPLELACLVAAPPGRAFSKTCSISSSAAIQPLMGKKWSKTDPTYSDVGGGFRSIRVFL